MKWLKQLAVKPLGQKTENRKPDKLGGASFDHNTGKRKWLLVVSQQPCNEEILTMQNILHTKQNSNNTTTECTKNTASTESASKQNIPGSSSEDKNPSYYFSRELATKLNPKRPDNNASMIIFGLWLLQRMPLLPYQYHPMVEGKRGCYASLRELERKYPWLEHNSILKILRRAAIKLKGQFVVDADNENSKQGKLHFWISPKLIKEYRFSAEKKRGLLQVKLQDVINHGLVGAMLISNLEYITEAECNSNPVKDEAGNIFRSLSPTVLSERRIFPDGDVKSILPCSRKSITEALTHLKEAKVFKEHATTNNFYTLVCGYIEPKHDVTKVTSDVTKVTTFVTKGNSGEEVLGCKMPEMSRLQQISETSYTNTYANSSTKCLLTETLSLRSNVSVVSSNLSSNAKMLNNLIAENLSALRHKDSAVVSKSSAFRQKEANHGSQICIPSDHATYKVIDAGIHDEKFRLIGYDFIYDFIPVELETGKPYSRTSEVDQIMKQLRMDFRMVGFKYTEKEMVSLRQIFIDHPLFDYEQFGELWYYTRDDQILGHPTKYAKEGYHWSFFACRVKSLKSLLRYWHQLIKEYYVRETGFDKTNVLAYDLEGCGLDSRDDSGRPIFDYSEMPEPFFSMAFGGNTPNDAVTYRIKSTEVYEEIKDDAYRVAHENPAYRRHYKPRFGNVIKYERYPLYYADFVGGEYLKLRVNLDRNPIIS